MKREIDYLPPSELGFWLFEGNMKPSTQEAFGILWHECRRQARRREAQARKDRPAAERSQSHHLKLVPKD